jgi:two-component system, cell cycle response regulator CtrA
MRFTDPLLSKIGRGHIEACRLEHQVDALRCRAVVFDHKVGKLYDYEVILLDLNLPDMSGYEALKTLRANTVSTPILILSALAGTDDKVRALGFGADDYMTKPFHKDELVARIHAIARRSRGHARSVIEIGELRVNIDAKTVEVHCRRVHLTGKEYHVLELLSLRKDTPLTKEIILKRLYSGMDAPELKVIDVFICKLRRKLKMATGGEHYIETVWDRGYVLRDPAATQLDRVETRSRTGLISHLTSAGSCTPPRSAR